ncbi:hypothetical protein EDB92DRAFT_2104351 [Lactarius akahatsu]|uniref:Uncharacterized protein n=1 Tax=Lactarius akahatsu TaxID=416441 RepID=A0AAD4LF48_9AGAM|nr:hypothetical protein EDB92DRAFT_2104351 [Lactarius akahatsu]
MGLSSGSYRESTDFIAVLQDQAQASRKSRYRIDDGRMTKWPMRTVQILYTLPTSTMLGEGIGLPFPPAKAILAGFGILFDVIKDVGASYDAFLDLLELSEYFLRYFDINTKIPPTSAKDCDD